MILLQGDLYSRPACRKTESAALACFEGFPLCQRQECVHSHLSRKPHCRTMPKIDNGPHRQLLRTDDREDRLI